MKGMLLLWTFALLILLGVFLFFLVRNLATAIDETIETSAVLGAEQIAGVINALQTMPSETVHRLQMPRAKCTIEINENNVNLTMTDGKKSYIASVTKILEIKTVKFECSNSKSKDLFIMRCSNSIISSEKDVCHV